MKRHQLVTISIAFALMAVFAGADAADAPEAASGCADCHNSPFSLAGMGEEKLREKITAMRDNNDQSHPITLSGLSDDQIAEIARYFSES